MFLAAAPYFSQRFQSSNWAASHYQSSILSVSTITNLAAVFVLAEKQKDASYPRRIVVSLIITIVVFGLLTFSTVVMNNASVGTYFVFLMLMVFGASLATGVNQNGVFAYVAGTGRQEYTQAVMTGQAVAGVLPCVVQILSVLATSGRGAGEGEGDSDSDSDGGGGGGSQVPEELSLSAFIYFVTATAVSGLALLAFVHLLKRESTVKLPDEDGLLHGRDEERRLRSENEEAHAQTHDHHDHDHIHKKVPLTTLFRKLRWLSLSILLCFAVTMVFPVFTSEITSVHQHDTPQHPLTHPTTFIPLAFLLWNLGDLLGRVLVAIPSCSLSVSPHRPNSHRRPRLVFILSLARLVFIPLYLLCNVRDRGAVVESDLFYLVFVQLLFGLSNGYLGSCAMMGAGEWAAEDEKEAAGVFMSLMLVGGLTVGSLGSFLISGL